MKPPSLQIPYARQGDPDNSQPVHLAAKLGSVANNVLVGIAARVCWIHLWSDCVRNVLKHVELRNNMPYR